MKPVYIIIGIPGAGKNTQGALLAQELRLPHIDAGETFERIVTEQIEPYWSRIEDTYTSGQPIPSECFIDIICNRLQEPDCSMGIVFTQNTKSVEEIGMMLSMFNKLEFKLMQVFSLEVPPQIAIQRNIDRLEEHSTAKDKDIDTLKTRINNYMKIYPSIRDFYAERDLLFQIDGALPKEAVFQKILQRLNVD